MFISYYESVLGRILLASDELGITGLLFENQKYYAAGLTDTIEEETEVIVRAKQWLNEYFEGKIPTTVVPLHPIGTPFQLEVWNILLTIPYGTTMTYNDIAHQIANNRGIERMSAQAVGGAVGHNKLSLLIPCHRVVGTNGSLTGYAGGVERKRSLLQLEHGYQDSFYVPRKGSAL